MDSVGRVLSTQIVEFLIERAQKLESQGDLTGNNSDCWLKLREQDKLGSLESVSVKHCKIHSDLKDLLEERRQKNNARIRRNNARRKNEGLLRDKKRASATPTP